MDAILEPIGEFWNGFLSNPIVQLASQLIVIYVVLLWLGTAYWAFRDMQARTENPILPYFAAALIIFFTPLLFMFAVVLYLIVRPRETLAEVYERSLAEESPAGRGREERALPGLPRPRRRGVAGLPELPDPAAPRLPVVQPAGRADLAPLRVLRHRVRARPEGGSVARHRPGCRRRGRWTKRHLAPTDTTAEHARLRGATNT